MVYFALLRSSSLLSVFLVLTIIMAEQQADCSPSEGKPAVHIVYTERPPEGEGEVESYHIKTLASVLGSEEAAKEALLYSYKTAASGFSAKLTPEQVSKLSKQPGVLQIVPDTKYELHTGTDSVI